MEIKSFKGKDLRIQKSYKALHEAMLSLLGRQNFNSLTVNDICAKALVSRAAFYAHFRDKYDLLEYLLNDIKDNIIEDVYDYQNLECKINEFVASNKKLISNIILDANNETLALIRKLMLSIVSLGVKRKIVDETNPKNIILFNFLVGGLVNTLTWIVENDFPPNIAMMNKSIYKMIEIITVWDAGQ